MAGLSGVTSRTLRHYDAIGLLEPIATGAGADDPRVQALVARHHAQMSLFWTPSREAYEGLGQMYVDDARFTATYDAFVPGLAVYLRDAILRWSADSLG